MELAPWLSFGPKPCAHNTPRRGDTTRRFEPAPFVLPRGRTPPHLQVPAGPRDGQQRGRPFTASLAAARPPRRWPAARTRRCVRARAASLAALRPLVGRPCTALLPASGCSAVLAVVLLLLAREALELRFRWAAERTAWRAGRRGPSGRRMRSNRSGGGRARADVDFAVWTVRRRGRVLASRRGQRALLQ